MEYIHKYISKISVNNLNNKIIIKGWIKSKRDTKKIIFLVIRDGTDICQCFIHKNNASEILLNKIKKLTLESSVYIEGVVISNINQSKKYEIQIHELYPYQLCNNFPIGKKNHSINFLIQKRHLWLRSQKQWAIMKIRSNVLHGLHTFFNDREFIYINTPILTSNFVENTTTLFKTNFYNSDAYLSQSGQLYGEAAAMSMNKIYTLGPTFRAEKSKTRRHLSEFWMLEPEIAFYDLNMIMNLMEELIIFIIQYIINNNDNELKILNRDINQLKMFCNPFKRITYEEIILILNGKKNVNNINLIDYLQNDFQRKKVDIENIKLEILELQKILQNKTIKKKEYNIIINKIDILQNKSKEILENINNIPLWINSAKKFQYGNDLGGSDETALMKIFNTPVMIYNWPYKIKPFYMKKNADNNDLVNNVDLLAPEGYGEIAGGSEREDDLNILISNIKSNNININDFQWYIDLRKYGSIPHSGFGLGIERLISWICKTNHVRETMAFPRMYGNISP